MKTDEQFKTLWGGKKIKNKTEKIIKTFINWNKVMLLVVVQNDNKTTHFYSLNTKMLKPQEKK